MKKISLILVIVLLLSVLGCAAPGVAFAAEADKYTDVLADLQKDETFDAAKYPEKANDYSLDVFQIAESKDGELFLYVYQPSGETVTATEVRISTTIGDNVSPKDYTLTCLGTKGALSKYVVNNLAVKADAVRYYYVVQIARPWNKELGDKETNNKVSTVAYSVAKLFTAITIDGKVTYSETHEEVITITAKYCGYIRNFTGWLHNELNTDSHFVAFDTDRRIEKLMEATVTYNWRYCHWTEDKLTGLTQSGSYSEDEELHTGVVAELKADETHTVPTFGLFGNEYTWNEIESVQDFMKREEVTREAKAAMQGKKWILRFALTPVAKVSTGLLSDYNCLGMRVTDASILRLKFETAGNVYNLGVVDNKQTENNLPSNPSADSNFQETIEDIINFFQNFGKWLTDNWWVIIVGLLVIGLVIWLIVAIVKLDVKVVFKAIGKVLWWILKIVFYIVTAPVWLIVWGIRAIKNKKNK